MEITLKPFVCCAFMMILSACTGKEPSSNPPADDPHRLAWVKSEVRLTAPISYDAHDFDLVWVRAYNDGDSIWKVPMNDGKGSGPYRLVGGRDTLRYFHDDLNTHMQIYPKDSFDLPLNADRVRPEWTPAERTAFLASARLYKVEEGQWIPIPRSPYYTEVTLRED
jgi:hypothetical protein